MTATPEQLAQFVVAAPVPPPLLDSARADLADTLAAAAYAVHAQDTSWAWTLAAGPGTWPVWFTRKTTDEYSAILANGTLSHAADFDGVHYVAQVHPGVLLFPALLGCAQARVASARQILEAYVVGLEAMGVLGDVVGMPLRKRGIHPTPALGGIGIAAALVRLTGASADTLRRAWGLSSGLVSGVVSGFGSLAKPLGVGRTARDTLGLVRLAAGGDGRLLSDWDGLQRMLGDAYRPPRRTPGQP